MRIRKTVLLITSGPLQGKEFPIDKDEYVLGSGLNVNLKLDDSAVSRRHCEIKVNEQGYSIADLDSTNGTFVNCDLKSLSVGK